MSAAAGEVPGRSVPRGRSGRDSTYPLRGEPIVLLRYGTEDGTVVRDVLRFTEDEGELASLRYYYFCPETLTEVVGELGEAVKDNGYRYA